MSLQNLTVNNICCLLVGLKRRRPVQKCLKHCVISSGYLLLEFRFKYTDRAVVTDETLRVIVLLLSVLGLLNIYHYLMLQCSARTTWLSYKSYGCAVSANIL